MSNCYFLDTIPDTMDGIFSMLHESALIMQAGGGIGMDFSGLRPKGAPVKGTGSVSSGPVSFAQVWDAMCKTIEAAGSRRGAQMGIMRVDHPDIDLFINAKKKDALGENALTMFNLSVAVTDDFVDAVRKDLEWKLTHNGKVYKTVKAAELWDRIMTSNYYDWEPGILFIDRINKMNPLWYAETITGTNPCGEQPLPPYNSCNLGSFALPNFVTNPFIGLSTFDFLKFEETVKTAVRFMDNILDLNYYPLQKIREQSLATRRIGLGITGLTDTLSMLGLRYGSEEGVELSQRIMQTLRNAAYSASVDLSKERGAFPKFDRDKHLSGAFIKALPDQIQQGIYRHGIRNSHLITIAPTGTTSLFCGNLSSGVEPYFGVDYGRSIRTGKGEAKISIESSHYSIELYRNSNGNGTGPLPDCILANVASNIGYKDHLRMQGMLQQFVDASISKTIHFPEDVSYEEFKEAYMTAYDLGCKGCTTYRPNKGRHGIIREKSAQGADSAEIEQSFRAWRTPA
jgi:ribonucleoside-diphosphate reductase alpha chain